MRRCAKRTKVNIARYYLITSTRSDKRSDLDVELYNQAIAYLEAVREDKIILGETKATISTAVKVGSTMLDNDPKYQSASSPSWFDRM